MRFAHIALGALLAFAVAGTAYANPNPQQERMKTCNAHAQADQKTGAERQAFMKACLAGKSSTPQTRQERMKTCNRQATGKKGDARKAFMRTCLSGN